MDRKEFIRLAGATVVGIAGAGAVAAMGESAVEKSEPWVVETPMPSEPIEYAVVRFDGKNEFPDAWRDSFFPPAWSTEAEVKEAYAIHCKIKQIRIELGPDCGLRIMYMFPEPGQKGSYVVSTEDSVYTSDSIDALPLAVFLDGFLLTRISMDSKRWDVMGFGADTRAVESVEYFTEA